MLRASVKLGAYSTLSSVFGVHQESQPFRLRGKPLLPRQIGLILDNPPTPTKSVRNVALQESFVVGGFHRYSKNALPTLPKNCDLYPFFKWPLEV